MLNIFFLIIFLHFSSTWLYLFWSYHKHFSLMLLNHACRSHLLESSKTFHICFFSPPHLISKRGFPQVPTAETSGAAFPFLPHTCNHTNVHLCAFNSTKYMLGIQGTSENLREKVFMQTKEGLADQTQSKYDKNNPKPTLKQTDVSRKANSIRDCCPQTFVVRTFETKRVSKQVKAPGLCVYLFMFSLCRLKVWSFFPLSLSCVSRRVTNTMQCLAASKAQQWQVQGGKIKYSFLRHRIENSMKSSKKQKNNGSCHRWWGS